MGRQRTDFYRYFDHQGSVSRSNAGRVQWGVDGSQQAYLSTTGMPWTFFELEAVGSDAAWTVQTADTDARDSPSWEDLDSGTVSKGQTETIFIDRVLARHVALHLDGDGHTAKVYQSAVPLITHIDDSDPLDVEPPGKSLVGTQSISQSNQTAADVNPSSNGASTPSDIVVQNVGDHDLWVSTGASATGLKLKPGQSIRYEDHVADDADLTLYPDTSNGMTAEVSFLD